MNVSCAVLLLFVTPSGMAADIESISALCTDCHGEDGAGTRPDVPIIGGLSAFVLEENLFAFRDRARPCRETGYRTGTATRPPTDMCRIAETLSDDGIERVAAFFASKPFVPADQQTDPVLAATGAEIHDRECRKCHTKGGSEPVDHASILSGQWMPYLTVAFEDLRAGKRPMPRNMAAKLRKLSDDDVTALIHYYGSGPTGAASDDE